MPHGSSISVNLHVIPMQHYVHATEDMITMSDRVRFYMKAASDMKDHIPTDKDAETLT